MKTSELLEVVEHFFLDFIGTVLPGFILLFGAWLVLDQPSFPNIEFPFPPDTVSHWLVFAILGYLLGQIVGSIGETLVIPVVDRITQVLRRSDRTSWLVPASVVSESQLATSISQDGDFRAVVETLSKNRPLIDVPQEYEKDIHKWRNVAMTTFPGQVYIVYRFMFISLLNLGAATSLFLVAMIWLIPNLVNASSAVISAIPVNWTAIVLMILVAFLFLERRYSFYTRSMRVPFSMAVASLGQGQSNRQTSIDSMVRKGSVYGGWQQIKIYLAGGFRTGWQDQVTTAVPNLRYLDPRSHQFEDESMYALWDLEAINRCDYIFAYLERTNPAGYALALEIGFAKSSGKRILLVDEKSQNDADSKRYLGMMRECADVVFGNLQEGIDFLEELARTITQAP